MPDLKGLSHIDLTVSDCERSVAWWEGVLGFVTVGNSRGATFETRSLIHPSGIVVTLMRHDETVASSKFDERRIGLDHIGFQVEDRDELHRWIQHLETHGVAHSGVVDIGWGPTVVFRDPDNIQLEFFVHPDSTDEPGS
jgi:glyoxylase I family protein